MNRTAVKNYAIRARRDFQKIVTERANALGISAEDIAKAEPAGDMIVIKGRPFPKSIDMPRRDLVSRVQRDGFDAVIRIRNSTPCSSWRNATHCSGPCHSFSSALPNDVTELLMPVNLLHSDFVV